MKTDDVIIHFQCDNFYEDQDEAAFVPAGTLLAGHWAIEQPAETTTYQVYINQESWTLEADQVAVHCPLAGYVTPEWQKQVAEGREQEAQRAEQKGEKDQAQVLYARALVEFAASGREATLLGGLRLRRASLLKELGLLNAAIEELDIAAGVWEVGAAQPDLRYYNSTTHLDFAERAVTALMGIARIYLSHREQVDNANIQRLIDRLLRLNKLIKKRYETKVLLLLHVAELWAALDEEQNAANSLQEADRFFSQQLTTLQGISRIDGIERYLNRLKEEIGRGQARPIKFTIHAETPDALSTILVTVGESVTAPAPAPKPDVTVSRHPAPQSDGHCY